MLILTAGNLGRAIGNRLHQSHGARCVDLLESSSQLESLIRDEAFVGVATWRPYPDLCQLIDDICFTHGIRWSMVELHGDTLTCGPLVIPTKSACHHCFIRRTASHFNAPEWERTIRKFYDLNPEAGVMGYPNALVEIGASALAEDAINASGGGRVRTIDVVSSIVRESEVIGIHNCPRCRSRYAGFDPVERSVKNLIPHLEGLLND